jgi:hypothetical protein
MQHPEPALLVAYLDGTLFHRDQAAVDEHLKACIDCVALVAAMRQKRDAEQAARQSRSRITIGAATVLVAVLGYGLWAVLPRSRRDPPEETAAGVGEVPPPAAAASAPVAVPPSAPAPAAAPRAPAPAPKPLPRAIPIEPSTPPAPRVLRRTRDVMVESSTDGGTTWVTEHTADRPIRAGAFVDADVAWVVGNRGLILRRTKNGWFGATPPADGNIIAVKASSPSRATITFEDGRVFTTTNGGVTWAPSP